MDERHGGIDHAVDALSERGSEDLLGRHIGNEREARAAEIAAAGPDVLFGQADVEARAEGVFVVERLEVQLVELIDAASQQRRMLAPALHGVTLAADADGGEDRVPELAHRLFLGGVWEDLLRPARNGDGGDAPGIR